MGDIYIPSERGTGRSRGFAFVRYYDRRDAEVDIERRVQAAQISLQPASSRQISVSAISVLQTRKL